MNWLAGKNVQQLQMNAYTISKQSWIFNKKSSVMMVLVGWCEESGGLTMMYLGHGNKSPDLTIQFPLTAN